MGTIVKRDDIKADIISGASLKGVDNSTDFPT
jgi:hypothetical protein